MPLFVLFEPMVRRLRMKIVMISSESVPFAKTGGLADVVGALPQYLKAQGHEVVIIMPKYSAIDDNRHKLRLFLNTMGVWMGNTIEWCAVYTTVTPDDVPVFFIDFKKYFERDGLYHDNSFNDYPDNPQRFAFLSRAALQLCKDMSFSPDIVHAHDWQTATALAYLKIWHWNDPVLGRTAGVLTIHNIAYQGTYGKEHYEYAGLQEANFVPDKFEDHGAVNYLKGGIWYADMVNTVSPSYARETRTPELAYGMAPYLNNKGSNYEGILNGVDYSQWNPESDKLIPAKYSPDDIKGKALCKKELQKIFMLEQNENIPVIGIISRFASQKGLDMLTSVIESIVSDMIVQFAILGSGDKNLESFYGALPAAYPGKIGSYIGYSNELSHIIEAGADFFIMPSIYEPCGLNQIYSLKYGTIPIVRATGGLDDTVEQYNEKTGEGTGFKFWDASPSSIYYTTGWAVSTWYDRRSHIDKMRQAAMLKDFSWKKSAMEYIRMYEKAIENKKKLG